MDKQTPKAYTGPRAEPSLPLLGKEKSKMSARPTKAILLIGPTGSGKSPLGEYLEGVGAGSGRIAHFDFGEQLRQAAASPVSYPLLSDADILTIRGSLETGLLLENHQFHIAENILRSFIQQRGLRDGDFVLLNGLPRHEGQAERLESIITVEQVISLECSEAVVYERIRANSGGDRTDREDDDRPAVAAKLQIFKERTEPLLDLYSRRKVPVVQVLVDIRTQPDELVGNLDFVFIT